MNEEVAVRGKLERALERQLPDAVWLDLVEEKYVAHYLDGTLEEDPREAWHVLKEMAEKRARLVERSVSEVLGGEWILRKAPRGGHKKKDERLDIGLLAGPKTEAMKRAVSEFFTGLAQQHPEVKRFRGEALLGRSLAPSEAHGLLASHAARFLTLRQFSTLGIPVVGHTSELLEYEDHSLEEVDIDHRAKIRVVPPGITKTLRYAYPRGKDQNQRCVVRSKTILPPNQRDAFGGKMPTLVRDGYTYPPFLWPGSVVDQLYDLSEELANQFDWPGKDAAAWFVLTGDVPKTHYLDARWDAKGNYLGPLWRIRLTIPPWVPAWEVEKAYRRMQAQILPGRNRGPDPKTLRVASFIWKQESSYDYRKRPPWRAWCKQWNEETEDSEDRFENYRHFRTYAMRGVNAVVDLNFGWPEFEENSTAD